MGPACRPSNTASAAPDVEEGEVLEVAEPPMNPAERVHAWLNLALFEALGGEAGAAFDACEAALSAALQQRCHPQLVQHVWGEFLQLAAAALPAGPPVGGGEPVQPGDAGAAVPSVPSQSSAAVRFPHQLGFRDVSSTCIFCIDKFLHNTHACEFCRHLNWQLT